MQPNELVPDYVVDTSASSKSSPSISSARASERFGVDLYVLAGVGVGVLVS
jgi:hypothetical protein